MKDLKGFFSILVPFGETGYKIVKGTPMTEDCLLKH